MLFEQLKRAVPIFKKAFLNCCGVWLFDNATNHGTFAEDALVASRIQMKPGGKQPKMRDGFIHAEQRPQPMVFPCYQLHFGGPSVVFFSSRQSQSALGLLHKVGPLQARKLDRLLPPDTASQNEPAPHQASYRNENTLRRYPPFSKFTVDILDYKNKGKHT
jgi:hypothetical protein